MDSGANSDGVSVYSKFRKGNEDFYSAFFKSADGPINFSEQDLLLIVGCGCGDNAKFLAENTNVSSITAFDVSYEMINYARLHNSHPKITYEVADVCDIHTWKKEWPIFTKVISIYVLNWVEDLNAAFKNISSCLKPGGTGYVIYGEWESLIHLVGNSIMDHPKWTQYLKTKDYRFPYFIHMPKDKYPDATKITPQLSKLLTSMDLLVKKSTFKQVELTFRTHLTDEEKCKGFILPMYQSHFRRIPPEYHQEFLEDLMKESFKFPDFRISEGPKYHLSFHVIDAIFEKNHS